MSSLQKFETTRATIVVTDISAINELFIAPDSLFKLKCSASLPKSGTTSVFGNVKAERYINNKMKAQPISFLLPECVSFTLLQNERNETIATFSTEGLTVEEEKMYDEWATEMNSITTVVAQQFKSLFLQSNDYNSYSVQAGDLATRKNLTFKFDKDCVPDEYGIKMLNELVTARCLTTIKCFYGQINKEKKSVVISPSFILSPLPWLPQVLRKAPISRKDKVLLKVKEEEENPLKKQKVESDD